MAINFYKKRYKVVSVYEDGKRYERTFSTRKAQLENISYLRIFATLNYMEMFTVDYDTTMGRESDRRYDVKAWGRDHNRKLRRLKV